MCNQTRDVPCKWGRYCIPDLSVLFSAAPTENIVVVESLESQGLPNGDGACLTGVDVSVAIFLEMCNDCASGTACLKSMVFVRETLRFVDSVFSVLPPLIYYVFSSYDKLLVVLPRS